LRETIVTKASLSRYAWPLAWAVIGFALWLALWHPTELSIRVVGLLLQLLGISTAFWGIISLTSRVKAWLGLPRHIVCELSTAGFAMGVSNVRAYGTYGAGPNPTIDTRLDALEKNVTAVHECITKEIEEQFRKIDDIVKREEQSKRENDAVIQKNLEAKATDDRRITCI
jgi:hypothetical protein